MQTINKPVAAKPFRYVADSKDKLGSTTVTSDPWEPDLPPPPALHDTDDLHLQLKMIFDYEEQNVRILSEARAKAIISPERTPQSVIFDFYVISPRLSDILKKDSVRSFLNLFENNLPRLTWGYIITAQAFNFIVRHNALKCAKVALEGKSPKLSGNQANPNYMNCFGFFPLHQAAAMFSLDMINLLIEYGASANVRTAGSEIIEGLLPLHVAIENACMHKYLEDNLLTDQKHLEHSDLDADHIYKLTHLLCLPEMKTFLDTVRLLAKYTDNVVDELWNYIKDGKLVHAAILLLAADQQLRNGYKNEGNGNLNGFEIIKSCIFESTISLETQGIGLKRGKNGMVPKLLTKKRNLFRNANVLVAIMSQAGEALGPYVQTHSEVPHHDVLQHVSSVLKDHGFFPAAKGIDAGDLNCCPYEYETSEDDDSYKKLGGMDTTVESPDLNVKAKEIMGNEVSRKRGYEMFIPYWRSVLTSRLPVKVWPSFALKEKHLPNTRLFHTAVTSSMKWSNDEESTPNHNLGFLGRASYLRSNHQTRRPCTAALTLLKMLKRA